MYVQGAFMDVSISASHPFPPSLPGENTGWVLNSKSSYSTLRGDFHPLTFLEGGGSGDLCWKFF